MPEDGARSREARHGKVLVTLTEQPLSIPETISHVRSPTAGAIVMFAGTTRDNFEGKPVKELQYSSYEALALNSMLSIAETVYEKHGLVGIVIVHRLGTVPIGEESILIVVSAPHRWAAWKAGEEALEETKEKVEIWKLEEFAGNGGGVWRANRDGKAGAKVANGTLEDVNAKPP